MEFFAVTETSVYSVKDERDENRFPIVEKIALKGESKVAVGQRLRNGYYVGVTPWGIVLYDQDHPRGAGRPPQKPEEMNLCFITTASHPEENKWYVEKDRKRLSELGFQVTEMDLKEENEDSLNEKLNNFDVVFVEGGNTFYLLKYVRESGFDKALKPFLDRGGIYVGVSAGTYIAGPDISPTQWKHAEDKNIVGLKDLRGLGLVDFAIFSHYKPEHELIIKENKHKIPYSIVALTDSQAILVENGNTKFIGPGEFKKFE